MSVKKIVTFGEIVWDIFDKEKTLGGAPLNFAYYCIKNSCDTKIISAIGNDSLAKETIKKMQNFSIPTDFVQISENYPTGKVNVFLDKNGIANYDICSPSAWDFIKDLNEAHHIAASSDAFVFGSLSQRSDFSRKTLFNLISSLKKDCIKFFDVNLRQNFYSKEILEISMRASNFVKLNDDELSVISKMFAFSGSEYERLKSLFKLFKLDCIILTRGELGHIIILGDEVIERASIKTNVVDTVGAGDAFGATFLSSLLNGQSLKQASELAALKAASVCGHKGAIVES